MTHRFTMLIQCCEEDGIFVVSLPDFGPGCHTHGTTYEEAMKNGLDAMDGLVDSLERAGLPVPVPAGGMIDFDELGALVERSRVVAAACFA